jgi:hypothetical protein
MSYIYTTARSPLIPPDSNYTSVNASKDVKVDGTLIGSDATITNANFTSASFSVATIGALALTSGFSFTDIVASTITTSGLLVTADLAVTNITAAGYVNSDTLASNSLDTGIIQLSGTLSSNSAVQSDGIDTGAITTLGGVGIAKDVYIGGLMNANGLAVKEGSNAKQGLVTLVAGASTVSNTSVTNSSRIFVCIQNPNGGTPGAVYVSSKTNGSNFIIQSTSNTDTSVVAYEIIEAQFVICFHKSCFVYVLLDNGSGGSVGGSIVQKNITELRYGMKVMAIDSNGDLIWSPIIAFTGIFPDLKGHSVNITLENGQFISLSSSHLLLVSQESEEPDYIQAQDVKVGDSLYVPGPIGSEGLEPQKVVSIDKDIKTGWWTPLTKEGTIVVNGIASSCHTKNHKIARKMYWPLRKYLEWFPYEEGLEPTSENASHWYSINFRRGPFGKFFEKCL